MTADHQSAENRGAMFLFTTLILIYAASYFQRTVMPGTFYNEFQLLGWNAEQIAGIGAAYIYAYSIPQVFSGILIDRYCGSRVVAAGGLIFVTGTSLTPFCTELWQLYVCRALTGVGSSTMYLSLVKETDRLFGRARYATLFGIAYCCGYGGGLCGKLPFTSMHDSITWQGVMLVAGIAAMVFYLMFLAAKSRTVMPPVAQAKNMLKDGIGILKNRYSWMLIFCSTVNFSIYFIIQTVFGEKFLMDFAGISGVAASGVIMAMTLVCMLSLLSAGVLIKISGNRRKPWIIAATGLCLLNSVLMILGICCKFHGSFFATVYLLYALSAGVPAIFAMLMQELNSRSVMTISTAFSNSCGYLAVAVFSPLIGKVLMHFGGSVVNNVKVYSASGYLAVFIIAGAIAAVSFLVSFFLPETRGVYRKN